MATIGKPIPWYLAITEAQFDRIYQAVPRILELKYLFNSTPTSEEEWKGWYLNTKLWRMNNIYYIINKDGDKERFTMNLAQHMKYARAMLHPRQLVLKSRQRRHKHIHLDRL